MSERFYFTPLASTVEFERAFTGNPVLDAIRLEWDVAEDLGSVPLAIARLIPTHLISISPPASPRYPLVKSYTKLLDWLQAKPDVCQTDPERVRHVQWLAARGYLCSTELLYNHFGGYLERVIAALSESSTDDAPPPYVEASGSPTTTTTTTAPSPQGQFVVTGQFYRPDPVPNTFTFGSGAPSGAHTFGSGATTTASAPTAPRPPAQRTTTGQAYTYERAPITFTFGSSDSSGAFTFGSGATTTASAPTAPLQPVSDDGWVTEAECEPNCTCDSCVDRTVQAYIVTRPRTNTPTDSVEDEYVLSEDYDEVQLRALRRQYPHETETQIYERSGQWSHMPTESDTAHPATQPQ